MQDHALFADVGAREDGALPDRVIVTPDAPLLEARDGRVFENSQRDLIKANFERESIDIALDEDHGMDAFFGGSGRATGWVRGLHDVGEFGLEAEVEWTSLGEQLLRDKIYRYFSPTLGLRAGLNEDGEPDPDAMPVVTSLRGGGLVNRPALEQVALASEQQSSAPMEVQKDDQTKMKTIAIALGLDGGADESACLSAIKDLQEGRDAAVASLGELSEELANVKQVQFAEKRTALFTKYADRFPPAALPAYEALAKDEAGLAHVESILSTASVHPAMTDSGLGDRPVEDPSPVSAELAAAMEGYGIGKEEIKAAAANYRAQKGQ
ncbi:MAG: phage protease [Myxococcota bacterium]